MNFTYQAVARKLAKALKGDNDYEFLYFAYRAFKFGKLPEDYLGKSTFTFTKVAWQMENVKTTLNLAGY